MESFCLCFQEKHARSNIFGIYRWNLDLVRRKVGLVLEGRCEVFLVVSRRRNVHLTSVEHVTDFLFGCRTSSIHKIISLKAISGLENVWMYLRFWTIGSNLSTYIEHSERFLIYLFETNWLDIIRSSMFYSHLQNRLRPLSLKNVSTDHIGHFLAMTPYVSVTPCGLSYCTVERNRFPARQTLKQFKRTKNNSKFQSCFCSLRAAGFASIGPPFFQTQSLPRPLPEASPDTAQLEIWNFDTITSKKNTNIRDISSILYNLGSCSELSKHFWKTHKVLVFLALVTLLYLLECRGTWWHGGDSSVNRFDWILTKSSKVPVPNPKSPMHRARASNPPAGKPVAAVQMQRTFWAPVLRPTLRGKNMVVSLPYVAFSDDLIYFISWQPYHHNFGFCPAQEAHRILACQKSRSSSKPRFFSSFTSLASDSLAIHSSPHNNSWQPQLRIQPPRQTFVYNSQINSEHSIAFSILYKLSLWTASPATSAYFDPRATDKHRSIARIFNCALSFKSSPKHPFLRPFKTYLFQTTMDDSHSRSARTHATSSSWVQLSMLHQNNPKSLAGDNSTEAWDAMKPLIKKFYIDEK